MSDIPADVMDTAIRATIDACNRGHGQAATGSLIGAVTIARAVMAERERCEKIARDWQGQMQTGDLLDHAFVRVAAAIRGPA